MSLWLLRLAHGFYSSFDFHIKYTLFIPIGPFARFSYFGFSVAPFSLSIYYIFHRAQHTRSTIQHNQQYENHNRNIFNGKQIYFLPYALCRVPIIIFRSPKEKSLSARNAQNLTRGPELSISGKLNFLSSVNFYKKN